MMCVLHLVINCLAPTSNQISTSNLPLYRFRRLLLLLKAAVCPELSVHLPVHRFQQVLILNVIILSTVASTLEMVNVLSIIHLLGLQYVHSG